MTDDLERRLREEGEAFDGEGTELAEVVVNRLPRARLISFRWQRHWMGRFFLKTRGANFAAIWLGPLQIAWRMPWLPDAAMRLQTHLFKHNRPEPTGLARWWRR